MLITTDHTDADYCCLHGIYQNTQFDSVNHNGSPLHGAFVGTNLLPYDSLVNFEQLASRSFLSTRITDQVLKLIPTLLWTDSWWAAMTFRSILTLAYAFPLCIDLRLHTHCLSYIFAHFFFTKDKKTLMQVKPWTTRIFWFLSWCLVPLESFEKKSLISDCFYSQTHQKSDFLSSLPFSSNVIDAKSNKVDSLNYPSVFYQFFNE